MASSQQLALLEERHPTTQTHRSKLLCHCANEHDEACVHRHSDVVFLGVIHPLRSYTMFDALITNIDLVIVLIVLFLVAPILTGLLIDAGQGDEE